MLIYHIYAKDLKKKKEKKKKKKRKEKKKKEKKKKKKKKRKEKKRKGKKKSVTVGQERVLPFSSGDQDLLSVGLQMAH